MSTTPEFIAEIARIEARVAELEAGLIAWLKESRACLAIAKDCTNQDECGCLYCRTDNLIRKG